MKNTRFWRVMETSPLETAIIAFLLIAMLYAALPTKVVADEVVGDMVSIEKALQLEIDAMHNSYKPFGTLPVSESRGPAYTYANVPVSAYNSVTWQTDATPCIGAQGTDICALLEQGLNTCAANFLPLGTIIEVEGLGTCEVRDRMNARYNVRIDWYMGGEEMIPDAKAWGVRYQDVYVYAF